ncbi:MAG: hypothetical protein LBV74_21000 [Tannerella sp.]|jgi:uncharacterized protein YcbK (DUF882 family)|nr:hypothetical protein [Tannerella sp.]
MITSKWFKEEEFKRCSPSCSLQHMQQSSIDMLDKSRDMAGVPFVLSSAFRSSEWDRKKGRTGTGAHTSGHAIDIKCTDNAMRWKIINALFTAGFKRIGIAKTYIHADNSPVHTQEVIWMY